MRTRLRALRTLLQGQRPVPLYRMLIPVTDQDGDTMCIETGRGLDVHEAAWATHASPEMRAAYAIHAVTLTRDVYAQMGYTPGWD